MDKAYDREYFDHWYRSSDAVVRPDVVQRKVRLAVAVAEALLNRPIRSVLDVGCGEAPWRALLKRMRPGLRYVGVENSEYVLRRFGKRRDIRPGTLGTLGSLGLRRRFDLVVCADVLEYIGTPEVREGLRHIRTLTGGVAYIEAFAAEDEMVGDFQNWHHRSAKRYRALFREAGLVSCGMHCYVPADQLQLTCALERCE